MPCRCWAVSGPLAPNGPYEGGGGAPYGRAVLTRPCRVLPSPYGKIWLEFALVCRRPKSQGWAVSGPFLDPWPLTGLIREAGEGPLIRDSLRGRAPYLTGDPLKGRPPYGKAPLREGPLREGPLTGKLGCRFWAVSGTLAFYGPYGGGQKPRSASCMHRLMPCLRRPLRADRPRGGLSPLRGPLRPDRRLSRFWTLLRDLTGRPLTGRLLTGRPLTGRLLTGDTFSYRKAYGKLRGGTLPELGGNFREGLYQNWAEISACVP